MSNRTCIVGIGASAGGLEALGQLVGALDPDMACSYVVLQHLSPAHRSMLARILARETRLQVQEATSGTILQAGTIYVIPATHNAVLRDGRLQLISSNPEVMPRPSIDTFFMSLAAAEEDRAIGIVLSGTGSDGTSGLQAIKAMGGVTIAQTPATAKYDGMPRSAIDVGAADHVLSCEEIAAFLPTLMTPMLINPADDLLQRLLELVNEKLQYDFSGYKMGMLLRRVRRRRTATGVETLSEYLDWISRHPQELDLLARDILISVTSFFRDTRAFEVLREKLRLMVEAKPPGAPFRIWVAGCATGEEAYSFAMIMSELLADRLEAHNVQIFATDLDEEALSVARRGIYSENSVRNVPPELLERHFTRINDSWEVSKTLREMMVFARHNLVSDPPFLRLDMVSCRNVLIYFDGPLQTSVLRSFHFGLNNGGLLFLGKSESAARGEMLFSQADRTERIFLKISSEIAVPKVQPARGDRMPAATRRDQRADHMLQAIRSHFEVTALLCDSNGNVQHTIGNVERYLTFPSGSARLFVGDVVLPELRGEVLTLLHRHRKTGDAQIGRMRRVKDDYLRLSIVPVPGSGNSMLTVILEPQQESDMPSEGGTGLQDEKLLEDELLSTREHLHTLLEEMATTNEEMQALNEEAHAANEELQASNEELEASNEELQAANEELVSLNEEFNLKAGELAQLTEEYASLYDSLPFPLLVFDRGLRLLRCNAIASRKLDINARQIREHVSQLGAGNVPDLLEKALMNSLVNGIVADPLLQRDGRTYQITVTQGLDRNNEIAMLIVTMMDVTEINAAHRMLRESQNRMSSLIETTSVIFAMKTLTGEFMYVNQRFLDFFQLQRDSTIGKRDFDIFPREMAAMLWTRDVEALRDSEVVRHEPHILRPDGHHAILQASHRILLSDDGRPEAIIFEAIDITAQKEAAHQQRISSRVIEQTGDAFIVTDPQCIIQTCNASFTRISGFAVDSLKGQSMAVLLTENTRITLWGSILEALRSQGSWQGELRQKHANGHAYPCWLTINRVVDADGLIEHFVVNFSDISQLKTTQDRAEYLSSHDALTGLPNRTSFQEVLEGSIALAQREHGQLAVLFIDVDNFKIINDSLGHQRGDEILSLVAGRLRSLLRPGEVAARIGGDEFAMMVPTGNLEQTRQRAQMIISEISQDLDLGSQDMHVSCSIGIAFHPADGKDAGTLLRAADGAMYLAKEQGRNRYQVYNPELRHRVARRNMIESTLRNAIANAQFSLVYQPILDITRQPPQPVGHEVLLRWSEPTLGRVPPDEFIPLAESSRQIIEIDHWVCERALDQLAAWQAAGLDLGSMSINISPYTMREPDFGQWLLDLVHDKGVTPSSLWIEITENALLEHSDSVHQNLLRLTEGRIRISLDDFGNGYSSLSYLTRLPLSQLKIDRSLVQSLDGRPQTVAIVRAILSMARALDISVVAEGVETSEQMQQIMKEGCTLAQGYHYARPLPADQLHQQPADLAGPGETVPRHAELTQADH